MFRKHVFRLAVVHFKTMETLVLSNTEVKSMDPDNRLLFVAPHGGSLSWCVCELSVKLAPPWTLGSAPSPRRPSSPRSCAADSSPVSVGFTPMSVCSVGPSRRGPGTSDTRSCGAVDSRSSELAPCQGLPQPLSLLQILRVSCSGSCPVRSLGREDPLEKGQATHSSVLGLPLWLSW